MESAVSSSTSWVQHRHVLHRILIESLEKDASWVELYGITGELHVPNIQEEEGELKEALHRVKEVRSMQERSTK